MRALVAAGGLCASTSVLAASVSMQGLVEVVIDLIIIGVVFGLLYYLVDRAPFLIEPWKAGIKYLILFVAVIFLINLLLGLAGHSFISLR